MQIGDIRPLKADLREHYKSLRREMPPQDKEKYDHIITRRVVGLWQYKQCNLLLTYVSTPIEVDTFKLIQIAISDGKKVAVPRCIKGTRNMEFYTIHSLDDLEPGSFGVLEPIPEKCELLKDYTNSLCIVPALCYDWKGFRLGYGKGYYDRFLAEYNGNIIGICYSDCICRRLPHGRFDKPVELLVTDRYLRRIEL